MQIQVPNTQFRTDDSLASDVPSKHVVARSILHVIHQLGTSRASSAIGARPDMKLDIQWIGETWRYGKDSTVSSLDHSELLE